MLSQQALKLNYEASERLFQECKSIQMEESLNKNNLDQFKNDKIKILYPHKVQEDGNRRKYYCREACSETPGYFCCCNTQRALYNSPFNLFGLGVCLYFKFTKHATIFYMLMGLFAILSCAICYAVAAQSKIQTTKTYNNFLFSTTYGSFGAANYQCSYSKVDSMNQARFNVQCPNGYVRLIQPVFSNQSLNSLFNCKNQRKKIDSNDSKYHTQSSIILNQTSCQFGDSSCSIVLTFNPLLIANKQYTVSYTYECQDMKYFFGSKIYLQSRYFFYGVVGLDFFVFIWLIIFMRCDIKSQEKEKASFKRYQYSLDNFTIQISGFTRNRCESQLNQLLSRIERSLKTPAQQLVFTFTVPLSGDMIKWHQSMQAEYHTLYNFIEGHFLQQQNQLRPFREIYHNKFMQLSQNDTRPNLESLPEYHDNLKTIIKQFGQVYDKKFQEIEENDQDISIYLIMNKPNLKDQIVKFFRDQQCCGKKFLALDNTKLYLEKASLPDMIKWQNRQKYTSVRVCFSWLLVLIICAASYVLFGYIQFKQSQLFKQYNYGIDCNVLFDLNDLSRINNTLTTDNNYITCICKDQSLTNALSSSNSFCQRWHKQYLLYLAVPILISMGLVLYNVFVKYIFQAFTYFQMHTKVVNREISYTLKRAFLLIMNLGLIMVLLNINYSNSIELNQISFIFMGKYQNFTPDWYDNIGVVIILTMVFNITTPLFELILLGFIKLGKKIYDTRCFRVKTTKKTQKQYLEMYKTDIFQIGQRYAYLISVFVISCSFSGIIPILIPITAISLFLLYHSDKLLLFKLFQIPPNFTIDLHKLLIRIIYISIFAHFALTAYFLSEYSLIAPKSQFTINSQFINKHEVLKNLVTTYYIIPYLVIAILVFIFLIFNVFCRCICTNLATCFSCQKKEAKDDSKDKNICEVLSIIQKNYIKDFIRYIQYQKNVDEMRHSYIQRRSQEQRITTRILNRSKDKLNDIYHHDPNAPNSKIMLGLPSYEYLLKDDKVSSFRHILSLEECIIKHKQQQQIRRSHPGLEKMVIHDIDPYITNLNNNENVNNQSVSRLNQGPQEI